MKTYFDIRGDGGSRVVDQVETQRGRVRESLSGVRHLLAVGSGKGGVGKSTLTMQLALAWRQEGRNVAILDADLNGPSQARLGGLTLAPPLPGEKGLAVPRTEAGVGVVTMGSLVPESRAVDFASVAPDESYTWRATKEFSVLGELLAGSDWGALDVLLVDLPPGAERTFQYAQYFGRRAAFVLVTVPSEVSRGVVSRSVRALESAKARLLGYVENMQGYCCPDCGRIQPLFPEPESAPSAGDAPRLAAVELGARRLGRIPFDPALAAASDRGLTLSPKSPAWERLADAAEHVLAALEESS